MIESGVTLSISTLQSNESDEIIQKFNNNTSLQGYFSGSVSGRIAYRTSYSNCCTTSHLLTGECFFPNGTRIVATSSDSSVYISRSEQKIQLHFQNVTNMNGIYHCTVPNLQGHDQSFHFIFQAGLLPII